MKLCPVPCRIESKERWRPFWPGAERGSLMVQTGKRSLRVLFFEDQEKWHAVGLEHFILVQADDYASAQTRFERAIVSYVIGCVNAGAVPFDDLPPAPERYRRMFEEALLAPRHTWVPPASIPVVFEARASA